MWRNKMPKHSQTSAQSITFDETEENSIDKNAKSNQTFYLLGDFNINIAPNATNSSADKLINAIKQ